MGVEYKAELSQNSECQLGVNASARQLHLMVDIVHARPFPLDPFLSSAESPRRYYCLPHLEDDAMM
jgi:hypothetical protein